MASNRVILWLLAGLVLTGLGFVLWPGVDLRVAGWFHDPLSGFALGKTTLAQSVRRGIWASSVFVVALALIFGALALWRKPRHVPGRLWAYVLALYALGPGLVVEWGLKGHWGRARPVELTEFGGSASFTPAWVISDQCAKNCSFSGGEAAGATTLAICLWLILDALPLSDLQRRIGRAIAIAAPLLASLQRLAAGAHFLSDIVTSALLIGLIAALLSRILPPVAQSGTR